MIFSSTQIVPGDWLLYGVKLGDTYFEVAIVSWRDGTLEVKWISPANTCQERPVILAAFDRHIEIMCRDGVRRVERMVWKGERLSRAEAIGGAQVPSLIEGIEQRFDVTVNGSKCRFNGIYWQGSLRRFDIRERTGDENNQPSEAALLRALNASSRPKYCNHEYRNITGLGAANCQDAVTVSAPQDGWCYRVATQEGDGVKARYWFRNEELELFTAPGSVDEAEVIAVLEGNYGLTVTKVHYRRAESG